MSRVYVYIDTPKTPKKKHAMHLPTHLTHWSRYAAVVLLLVVAWTSGDGMAQGRQTSASESAAPAAQGRKRVALLIGNNNYVPNNGLSSLTNPVNDAQDMGQALRSFGFEVIVKTNLNRGDMMEAIEQFNVQAETAGAALFFLLDMPRRKAIVTTSCPPTATP
jgi:hypothetical protein